MSMQNANSNFLRHWENAPMLHQAMSCLFLIFLLLNPFPSNSTEVTDCFDKAWAHPDDGGLGLPRGGAIELCQGAKHAAEVLHCYEIAWDRPEKGGLGLHRGGAIELCKGATNAIEVTECYAKAWASTESGGLGLHRGGAVELCKRSCQ